VLFTLINIVGVSLSVRFELILTVVAVVELCIFGAVALPHFSWEKFSTNALPNGWSGAFAALPFAMWFYLAIEGIANVAEDAKNPQRDLPKGFLAAMATLVALTVVTLFGAVGADGWESVVYDPTNQPKEIVDQLQRGIAVQMEPSDSPLPLAMSKIVDRDSPLFSFLTGIGLIGLIASFHGILIAGSRSVLELGRTRYVPAVLGEVHAGTKTPVAALLANMVIGIGVLLTGRTTDIILIAVFGALTLYVLSAAAVIELRRTAPDLERPYKTPLYPVTPVIAFALALVALGAMLWSYPQMAVIYGMLMAVAWLLFILFVPPERRASF
jgi:ethanolamine permease